MFGNESARISGKVAVNHDGSKTFHGIEIKPFHTDFDFEHRTLNHAIEISRELARRKFDPKNQGVKYDIRFPIDGRGRVFNPFTDSQLSAAVRDPGRAPPGLLPSVAAPPPPYLDHHLQYLDQASGNDTQASASSAGAPEVRFVSPASRSSSGNDIGNWIASLAGVDPEAPMQPAPQQADRLRGIVSNEPIPDWPFPPPIFNRR